jgi:Ca2+-binding RTX toxin-like protein
MPLLKTLSNELNTQLFRHYNGTSGDDILYGDGDLTFFGVTLKRPTDDVMHGGDGNDQIYGNDGNDRLFGDNGNDVLSGSIGNDQLTGGAGADELVGGDGADIYNYGAASDSLLAQHDTVYGFDFAQDRFHFDGGAPLNTSTRTFQSATASDLTLLLGFVLRDALQGEAALVALTGAVEGTYLFVDSNNQTGFQANGDIVIELVGATNLNQFGIADLLA